MKLTKTQKFMLYSLGRWFDEANKKIKAPLEVSISKSLFIGVVKKANIADKQARALYKNLEILGKKKLIAYDNKELKLAPRGSRIYGEINRSVEPYIILNEKLRDKDPISYTKRLQTVFR